MSSMLKSCKWELHSILKQQESQDSLHVVYETNKFDELYNSL